MGADLLVIRHSAAGAAAYLSRNLDMGVINAGDGEHEHPTQGLLDLLSLQDAWQGAFEGRRLAIVGDIAHSRVARSAIRARARWACASPCAARTRCVPASVERLGCPSLPASRTRWPAPTR